MTRGEEGWHDGQLTVPGCEDHKLARTTDPETSHAGARDSVMRRNSHKARLLLSYAMAWGGLTDDEAALMSGLASVGYWKRCSELRRDLLIEPTGEKRLGNAGSDQMVCKITDKGRAARLAIHRQEVA